MSMMDGSDSFLSMPHGRQGPISPSDAFSGWRYTNLPRAMTKASSALPASGTLLATLLWLPAGITINTLGWISGSTAAGTPTHHWMVLMDSLRFVLVAATDKTTTAIAANTVQTYTLSTPNYFVPYEGYYYAGLLVTATTMPTAMMVAGETVTNAIPPILTGSSTTALTTPPAAAVQENALTTTANTPVVLVA
jgi:hypothetical protein